MEAPPSVPAPAPRSRRTSSNHVADALRAAIDSGHLPDGAELNQVELAAHFGVSRVPVREAIRLLQAEGLVEAAAHRRAVVRGLDLAGLAESYEVRALLEGHLTELAVPHVDRSRLTRLGRLNRAMRSEGDELRWLALDAEFHRTLYEPAGRPGALEIVAQLRRRAERYVLMRSRPFAVEGTRHLTREHAQIVRMARAGEAANARAAVERHLLRLCDAILKLPHEPPESSMARRPR
ncbi:GntR family transcriptional regulator [Conexibacter stalactiti]|uniref:GntR family transcriptional regulator n=1 Tax=Conexibacter stalactiti TaxID=1940611 RepID=A0ABU4HY42_9ACTN|nr:GntR family transcriptional regulator [Conexibacter stalactiti]MDW5598223.1 GntR family transcriptional regulator [Conexibacter stalactiti]MEC5038865.1 GntR family transcriptional regulator [Conexibacter stalactiti]